MKTFLKGFALVTGLFTLSNGLYLSAPVTHGRTAYAQTLTNAERPPSDSVNPVNFVVSRCY